MKHEVISGETMRLLLPLVLIACEPPPGEKGADPGDGLPAVACPAYSGLTEVGRTWTWQEGENAPNLTVTLTSLEADGVYVLTDEGYHTSTGVESYTTEGVTVGRCDADGAWITERTRTVTIVYEGGREEVVESSDTYDPPYLSMPAGAAEGGSWTFETTLTQSGSGESASSTWSESLEAVGLEPVSVPAGNLEAMEFVRRRGTEWELPFWADAEIGTLTYPGAVLVEVE